MEANSIHSHSCMFFSPLSHKILKALTAPERGSTLFSSQRHLPAGGCYDASPCGERQRETV